MLDPGHQPIVVDKEEAMQCELTLCALFLKRIIYYYIMLNMYTYNYVFYLNRYF